MNKKENKKTPKVENTFKKHEKVDTPVDTPKKTNNSKNSSKKKNDVDLFKKLTSNESKITFGLFILISSLFITIACFSYLKNWQADDNAVSNGFLSIFNSNSSVNNSMGKFGAWISFVFVKKWFGLGSFFLIIFFINSGLLLLNIKLLRFKDSVIYFLGFTIWFSTFIAAIFSRPEAMIWGGLFGHQIKDWIVNILGNFGLITILFVVFAIYVAATLNIKLKSIKLPDNTNKKIDPIEETDETTNELKNSCNNEESSESYELIEIIKDTTPSAETDKATISHGEEIIFNNDTPTIQKKPDEQTTSVAFTVENEIPISNTEDILKEDSTNDEIECETEHYGIDTLFDPRLELRDFKMPTEDLLIEHSSGKGKVSREELEKNKNRIVETLGYYDIKISEIKATIGPTVTMYEIVPAPGIRISKIKSLEDDIALSLSALGIRIIAPIPGKGTIGIEVPNENGEIVSMRSMVENDTFKNSKYELPFAIGKTITNEVFVGDLAKLPHLLIAGATGQGKSVGLNAIICSLLYKKHPSELKFVLVDPKKVELALYAKIEKHYLAKIPGENEAIITDVTKAVGALNSLTKLMDTRYDLLKLGGAKNIIEYNNKFINRRLNPENGHHFMPYIVVVVDEFADLIMQVGREVELPVARIAQLARAVGIHLIIATQRPSVDVITGKIKANFPARIAFKVAQKVDSRTILDGNGADQLIGRGDMLYSHGSTMQRIQCAFIDTPEIENLTEFIGSQRGYSDALELPEYSSENSTDGSKADTNNLDKLFKEAAQLIVASQQGSTSMLQTKLGIGFARARRIIDQLESVGIVGMQQGSKPREVLIHDLQALEQFLGTLN